MQFLGIDPGVAGGIAIVSETGLVATAWKMPATEREMLELLGEAAAADDTRGMVEKLGGMPRDKKGRPMQSPTTMFKMGTNFGKIHMALVAAGIAFDQVLPRDWQAQFGLLRGGKKMTNTEKKNTHKAKAEQLFPLLKITHAVADALLIAEYCRRLERPPKPF